MKLGLTLLTCGRCGKPRGRHHLCRGGKRGRDRIGFKLRFTCSKCGRETGNLFTHTCAVRSDWAKRRKAAERAEKARVRRERRRRMRAEAAKRRKAAAKERREKAAADRKARKPRASPHNPRTCRDENCVRYPCRMYQEGFDAGQAAASEGGDD